MATVARPRVNLRTGPSTDFPIIRVVVEGESYPILAKDATGDWYMLDRGNGQIGWISAPLVTVAGDVDSILVAANLPSPPEPTATP
ncbi:MAG: SH3 domain-containing protein [Caldilineaceae bacterium]